MSQYASLVDTKLLPGQIMTGLDSLGSHGWRHFSRPMFDHLLPAAAFGFLALVKLQGVALMAVAAPVGSRLQEWLSWSLAFSQGIVGLSFTMFLAFLFLTRKSTVGAQASPMAKVIALAGTFIMWIAVAQPTTTDDLRVIMFSNVLVVIGLVFSLYALGALRFCFGIAPEARGLVTNGAYRIVRHPVYLGEFVTVFGYLLPVLAPVTVLIFAVFCGLQACRAALEESVLSQTFADYAAYRLRTPALLPWMNSRWLQLPDHLELPLPRE
jgi:protein-S-isoprenylcysteine O-methyltransferase Ste14